MIGAGEGEVVLLVNGPPARSSDETFDKGIDSIIVAKMEIMIFEDEVVKLI